MSRPSRSVLHLVALQSQGLAMKTTQLVRKNIESSNQASEIIWLNDWITTRYISRVKVQFPVRKMITNYLKDLRFLSLHPTSKNHTDIGKNFWINSKRLNKALKTKCEKVVVYSDSEEISNNLSSLITLANKTLGINVEIVSVNFLDSALQSRNAKGPREALLIIQPDWQNCGSAKTFDLVGNLAVENGYLPFRLTTSLSFGKEKIQIGMLQANGYDSTYPGISLNLNFSNWKSKVNLVAKFIHLLLSKRRHSVVAFKNAVYSSIKLSTDLTQMISSLSPSHIYVNHHFNMPLALTIQKQLEKEGKKPRIILDTHDLQFKNYSEQNYKSPFSLHIDPNFDEASLELSQYKDADAVGFVSQNERQNYLDFLTKNNLQSNSAFYAVPIRFSTKKRSTQKERKKVESIVGIFMADNSANRMSLTWFISTVLPSFAYVPVKFVFFGGIHKASALFPKHEKIEFAGFVESLEDAYASVDLVCLPIVSGNGIAIKTLEAIDFGKPFIGTNVAGRGLPTQSSVLFAKDTQQFIKTLTNLVDSDGARRRHLKEAAKLKMVIEKIGYEAQFSKFFDH